MVRTVANTICPACKSQGMTTIYPVITTSDFKFVVNKVVNGTIFERKCRNCGKEYLFPYPLLYHDKIHDKMVCYTTTLSDKIQFEEDTEMRYEETKNSHYIETRIVDDSNTLTEKSRLFSFGYDDKVIEVIKVWAIESLRNQGHNYEVEQVLCWVKESGEIVIECIGEKTMSMKTTKEKYEEAAKVIEPMLDKNEFITNINLDWAIDFVVKNKL